MKVFSFLSPLFLLLLLLQFEPITGDHQTGLIDLSDFDVDEFNAELETYDVFVIMFYASYCQQCMELLPDFQSAFHTVRNQQIRRRINLKDEIGEIHAAKLDCTTSNGAKVCRHLSIGGYPSIKLYKFGHDYMAYNARFSYDHFTQWIRSHMVNPSRRFSSTRQLNQRLMDRDEPTVVAIFRNNRNADQLQTWSSAARNTLDHWNFRDVSFYHIFEEFCSGRLADITELGLSSDRKLSLPVVIIHRPRWLINVHEKNNLIYNWNVDNEDLEKWIQRKVFGSVVWRTRDNADNIRPPLIVAYYDYDFKQRNAFSHRWRNRMLLFSRQYPQITFAISSSAIFRKLLRRQGLEPPKQDDPPLFMAQDTSGSEYLMRKAFTNASFDEFIRKFDQGQLKPFIGSLRSQKEMPSDSADSSIVQVVVSSNFPRLVTHSSKDVLLMFYAPWCKHSQTMLPMLDELAHVLSAESTVDVLKMDLDANEAPSQFEIPLYPTLYLIPAKSKQKLRYTGGPYIHMMVQFVAQHASHELMHFDRSGAPKLEEEILIEKTIKQREEQEEEDAMDVNGEQTPSDFHIKTEL